METTSQKQSMVKDLTQGSVARQLFTFAAPLFVANVLQAVYNIVDMIIVGADRIAANGDFANKIGTFDKAIVAKHFGIPFYVAAPVSTFDFSTKTGKDIVIEQRSEEEMTMVKDIRIAPVGSKALNPAFDVTTADLVTGFITEKGIFKPSEISGMKE